MNWRGILIAICLIVTVNAVHILNCLLIQICINWLLVITDVNNDIDIFSTELEEWVLCVVNSGGDPSSCENLAYHILPVWRLWVSELFMSLTGIEMFIVEASQRYHTVMLH